MGEPSLVQPKGWGEGVWGGFQELRMSNSELGSGLHIYNGMEVTGDTSRCHAGEWQAKTCRVSEGREPQ